MFLAPENMHKGAKTGISDEHGCAVRIGDTILVYCKRDGWFFADVTFHDGCVGYSTFFCEQFKDRDGLFSWIKSTKPGRTPWSAVDTYGFVINDFEPLLDHIRRKDPFEVVRHLTKETSCRKN